jgi:phosphate starvation-inducible PhoH-like protein
MSRKRPVDLLPAEKPDHDGRFHIELKNQWQKEAWDLIWKNENRLILLEGEAGTGKTFIATAAVCKALLTKRTRKIHLCRPYVSAHEQYGYLKGDLNEKLAPILLPVMDIIEQLAAGGDRKKVEEALIYDALGFLRGRTFNNWVLADEIQNASFDQLKLLATRIGKGCKMICSYDPTQVDNINSGIKHFVKQIKGVNGVIHYKFPPESQVREPIVQDIIAACSKHITE